MISEEGRHSYFSIGPLECFGLQSNKTNFDDSQSDYLQSTSRFLYSICKLVKQTPTPSLPPTVASPNSWLRPVAKPTAIPPMIPVTTERVLERSTRKSGKPNSKPSEVTSTPTARNVNSEVRIGNYATTATTIQMTRVSMSPPPPSPPPGVLPKSLAGGVPYGSQKPDPISDHNIYYFTTPFFRLLEVAFNCVIGPVTFCRGLFSFSIVLKMNVTLVDVKITRNKVSYFPVKNLIPD